MHAYPLLPNDAFSAVIDYLKSLQKNICHALEFVDNGGQFIVDNWNRRLDSKGISCILTNGQIFERAGVNFSAVSGTNLPPTATANRPELAGYRFQASGVSVVVHPHNPYIPTAHANVRFFCAQKEGSPPIWWFGGGFDLTPFYGFEPDCIHWHQNAKNACLPFGQDLYPRFKQWCDEYFYLKHRQEARGIGGLFFDDFYEQDFKHSFGFMQSVGNHFLIGYLPIVNRRKNTAFGQNERDFQCYRRGRYVEFNLLYDRGTLFGLQSGGRTESILMSLPPVVTWEYNRQEHFGSAEAALYTQFLPLKNWLND